VDGLHREKLHGFSGLARAVAHNRTLAADFHLADLFVNAVLLVLGCFLEGTTILLVIVPVLLPAAQSLGIDPVHSGVIAVFNIMIGLVTPPYGLLLFMMSKIADVPLFLPRLLGYKG